MSNVNVPTEPAAPQLTTLRPALKSRGRADALRYIPSYAESALATRLAVQQYRAWSKKPEA